MNTTIPLLRRHYEGVFSDRVIKIGLDEMGIVEQPHKPGLHVAQYDLTKILQAGPVFDALLSQIKNRPITRKREPKPTLTKTKRPGNLMSLDKANKARNHEAIRRIEAIVIRIEDQQARDRALLVYLADLCKVILREQEDATKMNQDACYRFDALTSGRSATPNDEAGASE